MEITKDEDKQLLENKTGNEGNNPHTLRFLSFLVCWTVC